MAPGAICEGDLTPMNCRHLFCSDKCRAVAWRAHLQHALAWIEENLAHALAQVQAIRQRRARPGLMTTEGRGGS